MLELHSDPFGRLMLADAGDQHAVVPVRAFPITAPGECIALVGAEGRELAWIERLEDLSAPQRTLIEDALAAREFMPEIRRIIRVSGYVTPCTWMVDTDRGETEFVLKSEEAIRRLSPQGLLIADGRGISFLVRDMGRLDAASRRVLDRFL
jgi:hypothetical protein